MSEPRVRTAHASDARAIAAIHVRGWRSAYRGVMPDPVLDNLSVDEREAGWRRVLSPETGEPHVSVLVIEIERRVVGFASGGPSRDDDGGRRTAEIYAVYVDPDRAGTGLGRILLAHLEEDLVSRGYVEATLWVLERNHRARRFYEAAGWRLDGRSKTEPVQGQDVTEVRYRTDLSWWPSRSSPATSTTASAARAPDPAT